MALNGTISASLRGRKYIIDWSAKQSISDNTSTITCVHKLQNDATFSLYIGERSNSCTVGGNTQSFKSNSISTSGGSTITLGTTTHVISHDSNGTKSVTISGTFNIEATLSGSYVSSVTASDTVTLDTIPRASVFNSLSCDTSYFNGTLTYKYTPQSDVYYNKCNISLNLNGNHISIKSISIGKESASQQTKTITLSSSELSTIYKKLPNTTSGTLRFTLCTYSDSSYNSQVGDTGYKEVNLTIPTDIVPSIGIIELDPFDITTKDGSSKNILVQNNNKLQIRVTDCSAGNGSSISSYTFSGPDITATTKSSTNTSYTFNSSGSISTTGTLTYTVKITDSRGRSSTKTQNIVCYEYENPVFSSFNAYRCNSNGVADDNGTYVKYSLGVSYSSVNSTNKSTVKIYYKKNTSNSWTACTNALTDSTTKSASDIIKNTSNSSITFDLSSTYSVYAVLIDNYNGSVDSSVITIFSSERILNIRANKKGIAFGKMAEFDDLLESKWALKVDNQITFGDGMQGSLYTEQNADGRNIVYLMTGQNTSTGNAAGLAIHNSSVYIPGANNTGIINIGSSGRKWNQLYAANGTINTSDRNKKTDIMSMSETQEKLFNELKPVTYKFIDGTSDRTHYGFISQDIEESLDTLGLKGTDFAGFCKDIRVDEDDVDILDENGDNIYDYSLRYSEFIALNTHMIQKLQEEITELKTIIEELKSTTQN